MDNFEFSQEKFPSFSGKGNNTPGIQLTQYLEITRVDADKLAVAECCVPRA
jgi:hypothetical protein